METSKPTYLKYFSFIRRSRLCNNILVCLSNHHKFRNYVRESLLLQFVNQCPKCDPKVFNIFINKSESGFNKSHYTRQKRNSHTKKLVRLQDLCQFRCTQPTSVLGPLSSQRNAIEMHCYRFVLVTYWRETIRISIFVLIFLSGLMISETKCLGLSPDPKVIKLFPCSTPPTQLSTKFMKLINVKMPTIVGILHL